MGELSLNVAFWVRRSRFPSPQDDTTSFPGWLREILLSADSSKKWEVVNAGGVSYASYRVASLMDGLSDYEPDLFVVYSGHNEFLERRTYAPHGPNHGHRLP
jgi:hypothetical protein